MNPTTWLQAFHAAYELDAAWATANLTTLLVYATFVGAIANVLVVIAAFEVQRRAFNRENYLRSKDRADLGVAALTSAKAALELYDRIIGFKGLPVKHGKRSDIVGRLTVISEFTKYYLSQGIINNQIVSALITTNSLIQRTILDLNSTPLVSDEIGSSRLTEIYEHRKTLRDGVEALIDQAFEQPIQTDPA